MSYIQKFGELLFVYIYNGPMPEAAATMISQQWTGILPAHTSIHSNCISKTEDFKLA